MGGGQQGPDKTGFAASNRGREDRPILENAPPHVANSGQISGGRDVILNNITNQSVDSLIKRRWHERGPVTLFVMSIGILGSVTSIAALLMSGSEDPADSPAPVSSSPTSVPSGEPLDAAESVDQPLSSTVVDESAETSDKPPPTNESGQAPSPQWQTSTETARPLTPGAEIEVVVTNSVLCDGESHEYGTLSGATPNGPIEFSSPANNPALVRMTASSTGTMPVLMSCTTDIPTNVERTVTDLTTGNTATYNFNLVPD